MNDAVIADKFKALCREDLDVFTEKAFHLLEPGTSFEYNWHIGCVSEHLKAVYDGQIQWLIINIPPRMLKSIHVAQIYPAWVLGHQPNHQFIGAAYGHSLAEKNVMKTRYLLQNEFYRSIFPETQISSDMNQKDYFTTTKAGQYKGTGIGGTITGFGCHTLIVDDPINPNEAASDTIRQRAIEEIRGTLFSRFNDYRKAKFIMVMQRLHDADPTGDLLKDGGYYHLKLPAVAPSSLYINLRGKEWNMEAGEYLSPRLDKDTLDKLETDMGKYHFAGQYLQEPVPIGGGDFRVEWINRYDRNAVKYDKMNIVILCDPSGGIESNKKRKKASDWSAYVVVGLGPDKNYYLLDIVRDRLNPTERVETLFTLHKKWTQLGGKAPKVGYEKYGMMTDIYYIREKMKEEGYNFQLVELGGTMSKEERIRRLIPDMQNGRWYFPKNINYTDSMGRKFDLVDELLNGEMPSFPKARFDDMLDALSRVKDDELFLFFPSTGLSLTEATFEMYNNSSTDSEDWRDW